jgi:hypothetical protein
MPPDGPENSLKSHGLSWPLQFSKISGQAKGVVKLGLAHGLQLL